MARGCDTRREVHVVPHIALVGDERCSGVETYSQNDRASYEALRDRPGRGCRSRSGCEREEEGVSLGIDLDAALGCAGPTHHTAVLRERLCVRLSAELAQESR